jgi:drug/metabolite transporter (DMT)-like permease
MIAVSGGFWLQLSNDVHSHKEALLNPTNTSKGSIYMVTVAFLWSISNAFDKIGVQNASPLIYGACIQLIVAFGSYVLHRLRIGEKDIYILLGQEKPKIPWKVVILAGIMSVVSYYINLVATQHLEVSYVIAIKRSGCIWSVLMGKILFKEKNLRRKLPSILFIIIGVIFIILGKKTS